MNKRTGFSMIELLVVIAIIAILASLLIPAIGGALETTRKTKCLSNVRQWALATNKYFNDGETDRFFTEGMTGLNITLTEATAWFNELPPYLEERPLSEYLSGGLELPRPKLTSIFMCPSVEASRAAGLPKSTPFLAYGMNSHIENSRAASDGLPFLMRERDVDDPSKFAVMSEVEGTRFANVNGKYAEFRHGKRKKGEKHPNGQGTTVNIAFMDGHAGNYHSRDIWVSSSSNNAGGVVWNAGRD